MSKAMSASKVDIGKVSFSTPKMLENGGKMIYMNYALTEWTNSCLMGLPL